MAEKHEHAHWTKLKRAQSSHVIFALIMQSTNHFISGLFDMWKFTFISTFFQSVCFICDFDSQSLLSEKNNYILSQINVILILFNL